MSRLSDALGGGGKLISFIVGGDPSVDESYTLACDVIGSGADVLEVGLPFSDPLADGPTIQKASERSLKNGMNTRRYMDLIARIRSSYDTPLVCLTYYNIVLQYGLEKFVRQSTACGLDGVIIPDLPLEEAGEFLRYCDVYGLDFIFLVAETTPDERVEAIAEVARGFIYVVTLLGTTGERSTVSPKLKNLLSRIRKKTDLPLACGFGISSPEHVRQVMGYGADAVIVGSAIVKMAHNRRKYVASFVRKLKKACG